VVEAGDIEEAMRAASAVGDDRLQHSSRGYVVPDSFTHGTSEQRVRWFAAATRPAISARATRLTRLTCNKATESAASNPPQIVR
jgi:hypothetical protein